MKRKILLFIGSRANWGRLKSVCKAITEHPDLSLQLILGASFYDAEVEFPVDARIQCLIRGDDHEAMALTTGILLTKVSQELVRLKPDIVLVHGDRYEVLAVAQAAAYMNIPLAHTEGGEVTGCIDDKVRNAITALADIHFAVTSKSAAWIQGLRNDFPPIYTVGSTALDSIKHIRDMNITKHNKIVVLYHPETSINESVDELLISLWYCNNVIIVNPNVDSGSNKLLDKFHKTDFEFAKNLDTEEYAILLKGCRLLVGNTSSGIKEGSFLGVPYVCVGNRQNGREKDKNTYSVSMTAENILEVIKYQLNHSYEPSNYFGDGTASIKIANILAEVEL